MRVKIHMDTAKDAMGLAAIASKVNADIFITDAAGLKVSAKSVIGALYSLEFNELWLESDADVYSIFRDWIY